ncbi:hypothetical protein MM213_13445 [Belliella sp. R4-6]|uniref:Uncharacterized protein n=1 Tax=Belliella alkalica TaxID=1730871 RepID=A0ABS9VDH5_9BACT|nr:hypothetical protein [Belliella alkalica]MCH7414498.1 hypothetical protein [Belliella alkalica]
MAERLSVPNAQRFLVADRHKQSRRNPMTINQAFKIIITLSLAISISSTYGQRTVLPVNNENFVIEIQGKKTVNKGKINFPITKLFDINEIGNIAILDTAQNRLLITNISKDNFNNIIETIAFPEGIEPISIKINGSNIFVGGDFGKEKIYSYNMTEKKWSQIDIPTEIMSLGKSVDDFLVYSDTLIALDNLIMPKYLLFYSLKDPLSINLIKSYEVPPNGTYEQLHRILLKEEYFIILSSTFSGYTGGASHVTVLDKNNLPDYTGYIEKTQKNIFLEPETRPKGLFNGFTISSNKKWLWFIRKRPNRDYSDIRWIDIAEHRNRIYLLEDPNKLNIFKIKQKFFKERIVKGIWHNDERFTRQLTSNKLKSKKLSVESGKWFVSLENSLFLVYQNKQGEFNFKKIK